MKAVILAGGFGTRLSEETTLRPKPMIEIGGKPILWHIMNIYSAHGINEFFIAAGYKAEVIKEYFLNFYAINNDVTIDLSDGKTAVHDGNQSNWKNWKVHIIDTGLHTQTGGRLKRLKKWLDQDDTFMFTYGDGVADVDISKLLSFHRSHGKLATVTTVRPPARFGRIGFEEDRINEFYEKPDTGEGWISGGYFVLSPKVIDYINDDETIWERDPLERLVLEGQIMGYRHYSFWSCMDTLREKNILEELWNAHKAPWKIW
ncbi:MAG: glucose-1-phosphate cytidylyltransferase [Thermodesulfovibrionales bacterium]|nr:glucose-1-phosphate cytidylyltransferase [Thermodesulfovibrionales bacterium]